MLLCLFQGTITDIMEENVVQPLLVSASAIRLATETVRSIMKIDDIVREGGRGKGGREGVPLDWPQRQSAEL